MNLDPKRSTICKRIRQKLIILFGAILWIEKLLETPIEDYGKNAVNLILAPYYNLKRCCLSHKVKVITISSNL
jgi:hypothetical protein